MPASRTITQEKALDLTASLGEEGEKEYRHLVRAVRMGYGSFFLFPIESNFSNARRDALLARLGADLADEGLNLRVASLTREQWNVFDTPALESPVMASDVVVLVGLEDTPGIVPEAGAKPTRPPALALLNSARETLHRHIPAPFLVWCPPFAYTALMEHAPDFFDHYTSLFQFLDADPETRADVLIEMTASIKPDLATMSERRPSSRAALEFYERLVAENLEPTPERAHALLGLADALWEWQGPNYAQRLERAHDVAKEALTLLTPNSDPYQWTRAQNVLGGILLLLLGGNRNENIRRAIGCFEIALTVCNEANFTEQWAALQNNLGNAYSNLSDDDTGENLRRAIDYYTASLRVYTKDTYPKEWASAQNNLGAAYYLLPTGDRNKNLVCAIHCYEAALAIFTETDIPEKWAQMQNNLGIAYRMLPADSQDENLLRAITCYEAALRIYTKSTLPVDWAWTQNNLGVVYAQLLTGDRDENLRRAINFIESALTVYTETDFPDKWALSNFNLAGVFIQQGDAKKVIEAFQKAVRGYRSVGLEKEVQEVEDILNLLFQGE